MVYIQSDEKRTLPHHFDAACALYGAKDNCQDVRLTTFEEVASGKFDNLIRTHLFVGSQEFMDEVFRRVDKKPTVINSDRPHVVLPMSDVRYKVENGEKLFIKPFQRKLFNGSVVDKFSISYVQNLADDFEVMVYSVLPKILSEWRIYILRHTICESKNYGSDFKISPDYKHIEAKIAEYKDKMPIAYTMDIGVCETSNGLRNEIIEFNDFYAIGNYGIDNQLYAMMLRERYFEIMRTC